MDKSTAYYTTDTNRLCPYPDMTEDDLINFENWSERMSNEHRLDDISILVCIMVLGPLVFAVVASIIKLAIWLV